MSIWSKKPAPVRRETKEGPRTKKVEEALPKSDVEFFSPTLNCRHAMRLSNFGSARFSSTGKIFTNFGTFEIERSFGVRPFRGGKKAERAAIKFALSKKSGLLRRDTMRDKTF